MNNYWFQVAHSLFQAEKLFSWGWRRRRNLCFAECWIVWWWWWQRHKSQICCSPCPYSCCPQSDSICRYLWIVVVLGVVGCLHCIAFSATFLHGTFFWQVPCGELLHQAKLVMFSLRAGTCYSFTAVQVLVQCCVKKKRSWWSQLLFGSRGTHTILIYKLSIVAPQLVVVVVFPSWTPCGSPSICNCTLTSAFHRVRGLCAWLLFFVVVFSPLLHCLQRIYPHFWGVDADMHGAYHGLK